MRHALDVPWIVAEYQTGRSAASLARDLGVDVSAIDLRLRRVGAVIRGTAGATAANLARDPSIRERMGRPRIYPVNPQFFDTLTGDSSYVVGLLQADGSNQTDRGVVCITLKASDAPHLEVVAEAMGAVRPLMTDPYGGRKLQVQCPELSAGLARRGVVSPKTHTASTHPALVGSRDYWRGVVDGDGTLCNAADGRRILSLVGSQAICSEFLAFCQARRAGMRRTVRPHKAIYSVHLSGADAVSIARVLYRGGQLALPRKRAVAAGWGCLDGEGGCGRDPATRPDCRARPAAPGWSPETLRGTAPTAAWTAGQATRGALPASAHQPQRRAAAVRPNSPRHG